MKDEKDEKEYGVIDAIFDIFGIVINFVIDIIT